MKVVKDLIKGFFKKQYIYRTEIDELLRMDIYEDGTPKPYYFHHNLIGSITGITDGQGNLIELVEYDPYGKPYFLRPTGNPENPYELSETSTIGNNYLFQGREFDSETNLYYFRARYYDPILSRFLSPDPMGYQDSMNLYQAFNNNPLNFVDPLGKWYLSGELSRFFEGTVKIYAGAPSPFHIETMLGFIPKYWIVNLVKGATESLLSKEIEPFLKAGAEFGSEKGVEKWSMWRTGNKVLSKIKGAMAGAGVATMFRLFDTIRALEKRELPTAFIEVEGRRRRIDVDQIVLYVMYMVYGGAPIGTPGVFSDIIVTRVSELGGRIDRLVVYPKKSGKNEVQYEAILGKETLRAELILRLLYIQLEIRKQMEEWGGTFEAIREWSEEERETYEFIKGYLTEKELEAIDYWIDLELRQVVRGLRSEYYWMR